MYLNDKLLQAFSLHSFCVVSELFLIMCAFFSASIHSQAKGTREEREAYSRLKALLRYHRHNGRHALLRNALREKRSAAASTVSNEWGRKHEVLVLLLGNGSLLKTRLLLAILKQTLGSYD